MGRGINIDEFLSEHAATEKDIESGDAKRCTKHNCPCGNVPLMMDAFYRDKTNKTGRTSWCKKGEADYNKPYNQNLKAQGALRKRDLEPEQVAEFEAAMAEQRRPRVPGVTVAEAPVVEKVAPAKAAPRKRAPRKKAAAKTTS